MFSEPVTTQFRTSHRPSCTVSSQILLFGTPGDVHSFRTSKDIALLYGNCQDQEQVYVVRRMTHVQVGARDVDKDPLTRFEREATDALVDRGFTWIMGSWVVDLQRVGIGRTVDTSEGRIDSWEPSVCNPNTDRWNALIASCTYPCSTASFFGSSALVNGGGFLSCK